MLTTTLNRRPPSWSTRAFSLAAMLALTVGVAALGAQSRFYSLRGTVLDPTNRVLPDTRLVLTNEASRAKYEVRSDAMGRYEFAGVPPGTYTLESILPGFRPLREVMEIVRNSEFDLRLRVGSLQETITVRSTAGLTTTSATAPDREEVRRRGMEFVERARAQCAASGTTTSVGGNILAPRKLFDARPVYPDHLKAANMGGTVTMDALIGTDGSVQDIQNLKGPHPDLEASAADAVRQWLFSTTLLNCDPIEVEMKVTTTFNPTP